MDEDPQKVIDPGSGVNQTSVRAHNERLVMTLVRRHGSLAKSEIARRSGLSAQTVSVIMRSLENDGLLLRGEPKRGKVGQPSIPLRLNPHGVYSIGMNAGRRSVELVMLNFLGEVVETCHHQHVFPTPKAVLDFAENGINRMSSSLTSARRKRIAGIGLSMPFEIWNWADKLEASQSQMDEWRKLDIQQAMSERTGLPTFLTNDATAACGAELLLGRGAKLENYLYFFVGTFIGGGVVLNHRLYTGPSGYAGAIAPLPVHGTDGRLTQLIDHASIFTLETRLNERAIDCSPIWKHTDDWSSFGKTLDDWMAQTAHHLAVAAVSACSFIDFEAVIIDGVFPESVRDRLCQAIQEEMSKIDKQGMIEPMILNGTIGRRARALGGATLPLLSRYLLDQSIATNGTQTEPT